VPFTISHAAAVLPLRKTGLPLAALMIGSMSPDFAFFAFDRIDSFWTHGASGLFLFCWPVGLLLWWFYVRWIETPTFAMLPRRWRAAFTPSDPHFGLAALSSASAAVIVGAATHIAWDSFTHAGRTVVKAVPFLEARLVFHGHALPVFAFLQHLSTAIGLLVLGIWVFARLRRAADAPIAACATREPSDARRLAALALLVASAGTLAAIGYLSHAGIPLVRRLFHLAVGGMEGGAMAWFAIALGVRFRTRE
jgi:hypothetical protein